MAGACLPSNGAELMVDTFLLDKDLVRLFSGVKVTQVPLLAIHLNSGTPLTVL